MAAGSWAELEGALSADEMSLWKLERLRGLFCARVCRCGFMEGLPALSCPCSARPLAQPLPTTCPFQSPAFTFHCSQATELFSVVSSPFTLPSLSQEGGSPAWHPLSCHISHLKMCLLFPDLCVPLSPSATCDSHF